MQFSCILLGAAKVAVVRLCKPFKGQCCSLSESDTVHSSLHSHCKPLHCTAPHCTALHCTRATAKSLQRVHPLLSRSAHLNDISTRVAILHIAIWVWRAVPALMYALALALCCLPIDPGAHPYNVVGAEPGPVLFQLSCNRYKLLQQHDI